MMQTLDIDLPVPSLATWSRTARPVRIGHHRDTGACEPHSRHAVMPPWAVRLDDILFGFSAATLMVVSFVVLPLAAWLR